MNVAWRIAMPLRRRRRLAPGAIVSDVFAAARWPDATAPTLVVGHQPVLGQVAAQLLSGVDADADAVQREWVIRKGAVMWPRHRERDGVSKVVLEAVQRPELL